MIGDIWDWINEHSTVVAIVLVMIVVGLFFQAIQWSAARTGPTICVDEQKLVTVTPVGHWATTSYIVVGERGRSYEYFPNQQEHPPRVGYPFCFEGHTETYDVNFWTLERKQ